MDQQPYFVLGNMAWNAALVAAATALFKRWMDRVETDNIERQNEIKGAAEETAKELKSSNAEHRQELKDQAKEFTSDLTKHLDKIYEQMRVANGRTSANEGAIRTLAAICEERHKNHNGG